MQYFHTILYGYGGGCVVHVNTCQRSTLTYMCYSKEVGRNGFVKLLVTLTSLLYVHLSVHTTVVQGSGSSGYIMIITCGHCCGKLQIAHFEGKIFNDDCPILYYVFTYENFHGLALI